MSTLASSQTSSATPLFTAGEVEQRTGVPATTLRQWERRYGLPNPQRSAGGYRLYSQNDLTVIEFFKNKIAQGVSVSRAAQLCALEQSLPSAQRSTVSSPMPSSVHPKVQPLSQRLIRYPHKYLSRLKLNWLHR